MERSLIKQVNRKNMAARLKTNKVKPVYFPNFFGIKKKSSLKWETLVGEKGAPVIADVISFDSSAPQKTREVIAKMSGDIPKTAVKRGMNESDYNEYTQLVRDAQGDAAQLEVLNLAFKDQDFVYNAVRGRFEWWTMQLMSKGGFLLNAQNNNGVVTAEFVGCGMPAENKKVSTVDWATAATADGLGDIEAATLAASAEGVTLKYAIMRRSDFILLRNQTSTTTKLKSWINQAPTKLAVTLDLINQYMEANMLPKIVVIDPAVKIEDKAHKKTTVNPWESKRVCLLPDLSIGDIQHGPIAAESSAEVNKIATTVKQDFVFIQKWSELEPFKEWTKAEANAIPVINDPDTMYILKCDGAAWSETEDTEGTDNVPASFLGADVEE
ncbi:major capsid protein [Gaoshiqia sediminis]|uniref:Major capsid protein n=1 Tax=Gaoshiqia sediminis TaxID=2986998 RepID=A0AA41Y8N9_9BACT|nr:major capsid protein [Gaoshiqia sediminis]MCW0484059.1 major capsid protein [Gaoshiqia sediminis]